MFLTLLKVRKIASWEDMKRRTFSIPLIFKGIQIKFQMGKSKAYDLLSEN